MDTLLLHPLQILSPQRIAWTWKGSKEGHKNDQSWEEASSERWSSEGRLLCILWVQQRSVNGTEELALDQFASSALCLPGMSQNSLPFFNRYLYCGSFFIMYRDILGTGTKWRENFCILQGLIADWWKRHIIQPLVFSFSNTPTEEKLEEKEIK